MVSVLDEPAAQDPSGLEAGARGPGDPAIEYGDLPVDEVAIPQAVDQDSVVGRGDDRSHVARHRRGSSCHADLGTAKSYGQRGVPRRGVPVSTYRIEGY
jgi:hypothetical protein